MQHLQKTEGWGCSSHSGTHPPLGVNLSFQSLTHCPFCNPFVFTFMRVMGGCTPWRFYSPNPPLAGKARNLARPHPPIVTSLHLCFITSFFHYNRCASIRGRNEFPPASRPNPHPPLAPPLAPPHHR